MLEDHYRIFRVRMLLESVETQRAVLTSYQHCTLDERIKLVLHWPRRTVIASTDESSSQTKQQQPPKLTHVPLHRVPPEHYGEYFYFGFLCHFLKYSFKERRKKSLLAIPVQANAATATATEDILCLSPVAPRVEPMVRLLDWGAANVDDMGQLLSQEAMSARFATECDYHWSSRPIDQYNYKTYFVLHQPRLSMKQVSHSRVQCYHEEPCQLVASNCQILVTSAEHFHGLTLFLMEQLCPVELPLSSFKRDTAGNHVLELVYLAAVDQLCYIETHGSQITVVFGERAGVMRLCSQGSCGIDIGVCELEYWSNEPLRFPSRYGIMDTDQILLLQCEGAHWHLQYLCAECTQYNEATQLYSCVQSLRLDWVKPVPLFFLGNEQLMVVPGSEADDWWLLYWQVRPIARFWLNPPYSEYNILFRLVLPAEAQSLPPFDISKLYIY
jgi:hypothetical protein